MEYAYIKRLIDIVGSTILGVFFLPIAAVTALAIKLDTRGPVLADTPQRVGKNGTLFKLYKFRSMVVNAHSRLRTDPKLAQLYSQYKRNSYKLKEDPRVTRVGRFIRKHSLDEIPQLLNVFAGDMSLVGPRPYYPDELAEQQRESDHKLNKPLGDYFFLKLLFPFLTKYRLFFLVALIPFFWKCFLSE